MLQRLQRLVNDQCRKAAFARSLYCDSLQGKIAIISRGSDAVRLNIGDDVTEGWGDWPYPLPADTQLLLVITVNIDATLTCSRNCQWYHFRRTV
jgi:hypothetical protein